MKDNQKEPKLTYALDSSGKMVHISNVKRGLSCDCRCPKCNELLVAKLGHEGGRQAHFAHHKGSNCYGSYMSALHKLAEQIIEGEKAVMAPAYKSIDKQKLSFEHVEVEQRVERKDLQPDIVGVTSNGLRWFIEIRNTHEVDEDKRAKLIESKITCLEIDVRDQTLENLKSFLLESTESREWINNPIYDKKIRDEQYRDETKHREKYSQNKDNKYDKIELKKCGLYCGINRYSGKCIYQKDEPFFENNVEYVFCDKQRREKDKKESSKNSVPHIIANNQEEPEGHYLNSDFNQQSIDEPGVFIQEEPECHYLLFDYNQQSIDQYLVNF